MCTSHVLPLALESLSVSCTHLIVNMGFDRWVKARGDGHDRKNTQESYPIEGYTNQLVD